MDSIQNFKLCSVGVPRLISIPNLSLVNLDIEFFRLPAGLKKLLRRSLFPILILLMFSSSGCLKNDCDDCIEPPEDFRMKIVDEDTGENLLDGKTYFPDSIEIYYFQNEQKKNASIHILELNPHENVVESPNLAWLSVGGLSKTFYIQLNTYDTDTLYLNVYEYLHYCCRSFPYESVLINGSEMENPYPGMYLLKK